MAGLLLAAGSRARGTGCPAGHFVAHLEVEKVTNERRERKSAALREYLKRPDTAARLSIVVIVLLIVMKAVASAITGSIGIRADAIHSTIDLAGVVVGFLGIRISSRPPDADHSFGHGKAQDVAGVVISALIFLAAGTIAYEAIGRLISGGSVEMVNLGIYVTAAAIGVNTVISWYALKVARSADSTALEASGRDMLADALSSTAVLVGLVLVRATGSNLPDPIVSLLVAALIVRTAFVTMRKSVDGLMDVRLPEAEEEIVRTCIREHMGQLVDFHELRTRKAGDRRHIYLHLVMPRNASVDEAHSMCDHLEDDIQRRLERVNVVIHVEPCDVECQKCSASCSCRDSGSKG
jgi:cation diffusion facilitator family transporter